MPGANVRLTGNPDTADKNLRATVLISAAKNQWLPVKNLKPALSTSVICYNGKPTGATTVTK